MLCLELLCKSGSSLKYKTNFWVRQKFCANHLPNLCHAFLSEPFSYSDRNTLICLSISRKHLLIIYSRVKSIFELTFPHSIFNYSLCQELGIDECSCPYLQYIEKKIESTIVAEEIGVPISELNAVLWCDCDVKKNATSWNTCRTCTKYYLPIPNIIRQIETKNSACVISVLLFGKLPTKLPHSVL